MEILRAAAITIFFAFAFIAASELGTAIMKYLENTGKKHKGD